MEDRDESLWAGLGSIEAFIDTAPTSPHRSPTRTPSPSWPWERLPPPRLLQVRLDDGEPALPTDTHTNIHSPPPQDTDTDPPAPDLDILLPTLPVATGRIEKSLPPHHITPSPALPPKTPSRPRVIVKSEPVLQPVANLIHLQKPSVPPGPSKLHAVQRSPVRVTVASVPNPSSPRNVVLPAVRGPARPPSVPMQTDADGAGSTVCSLKEKREREAKQFPKEVLGNLDGTTSAEVRKMNATERELVLYKRKLRNRESARRSRQKRQATLAELQEEIDDLMQITGRMVEAGISLHEENVSLREKLGLANAEIKGLRTTCAEDVAAADTANPATVALKMKLGG